MASGYVCIPDDRCGMVYRPVEGNAGLQSKGYGKMVCSRKGDNKQDKAQSPFMHLQQL